MEYCDLLIEPGNLSKYSNRELEKAEEIFNHGYETANHLITELLEEKGKIWK
jgi:NTE family protein